MVIEYGDEAVADGMVALTNSDIDGKDGMYNRKDKEVQLALEETAKTEGGQSASCAIMVLFWTCFGTREIWLRSGQPLCTTRIKQREEEPTSINLSCSSFVKRVPPARSLRR